MQSLRHEVGVPALAVGKALDFDDHGVMEEVVEQCGGEDVVTDDLALFAEAAVGGDHGALFVPFVDELEEQVDTAGLQVEVSDLVDDEAGRACEVAKSGVEVAVALGLEQGGQDFGQGGEEDTFIGFDGLEAQGGGEVSLPVPGGPRRWTTSAW